MSRDEIPLKVVFWLAIIFLFLLPFKSKVLEGTISYNPQSVIRQLGYVEGEIMVTREMGSSNLQTVKASFVGDGKEKILINFETIFWP